MTLKPKSFPELFAEAESHVDYWVAGTILEFTESLVREMERQGVTRSELARRIGATPAYVTKILRGKANFTLETMVRLARALGADLHIRIDSAAEQALPRAIAGKAR
jgi:transcriptional regulator with XRE-family HTH domain